MQTMRSSMKISDEIREWCDEADTLDIMDGDVQ